MKRCPECRRDYYDDTLLYCLDDGNALLEGPATAAMSEPGAVATGFPADEPQTAILHSTSAPGEAPTRAQIHTTEQTAVLPRGAEAEPQGSLGGLSERQSLSAHRAAKPQGKAGRGTDRRLMAAPFLLAIIVLGGFFGYRYFKSSSSGQINSIAVLPFENKSGNADSDYLSDGVAESLIYKLSQLPNLKVSPRSSVFRYKGKEIDVEKIGDELGVDAVMSGRIIQRGDNLTISVDLVDVRNKKSLWGEQYERKMSDLLATQREIASAITQKLQLKLSGEAEQKLAKKSTDNSEAYQLFLKGQFLYDKRTKDSLQQSIDAYQAAIKLDPNYARAYVGISRSYTVMPSYGFLSPNEAMPKSKAAVERALQIDPNLAEAHGALANILALYDWNWAESEREFKRAIELDPDVAEIHNRYSRSFLSPLGRFDESIVEIKRAVELEPLSIPIGANLVALYMRARKFDLALEQAKKVSALDPNHPSARTWLGSVYNSTGMYAEAISLNESILQANPTDQDALVLVAFAYAKSGRRNDAAAVIGKLNDIGKSQYVPHYSLGIIYGLLGEKDRAFAELEKALDDRDRGCNEMNVDFYMYPLRDDPRFKELLKRLNLPE